MQNKAAMEANFGLQGNDLQPHCRGTSPKPAFFIKCSPFHQRNIQRVF
jgi:hypothetical protein